MTKDLEAQHNHARMAGEISALKMLMGAVLSRCAVASGEDAETFIMTITAAATATTTNDEGDPINRAALIAYSNMIEQVEANAISLLDV